MPEFYDVDINTGNPSFESVSHILNLNNDVAAIVIPHMFGNLAEQRDSIAQLCRQKNIKVIDDCAAALGVEDCSGSLGKTSDAIIFSFGRNKHIDLGFGGLLATDEPVDIEYHEKRISSDADSAHSRIDVFDKIYKTILYSDYYYPLASDLRHLAYFIESAFVYRHLWTEESKSSLYKELETLELRKQQSISLTEVLESRIEYDNKTIVKYQFSEGSHPWRFNLLCSNGIIRKKIIDLMLNRGLKVSIWYPPVDPLFGKTAQINAKDFSQRILNFDCVRATSEQIIEFVNIINSVEKNL